ncbi:hypothetical protein ATY81_12365 [Rhizobium sp. R72]|uniref:hypothetical protein n=1 Tax=unclassified Rhizobium TaxID=2613769 RepID=UPI000B52B687|nr:MULTISPECIES: hypothetical protein [unclassified Rhizobium]OWV94239.1 hypothetical protein ATY81_12365 [Rhizobium sp. R72]OWV94509.1 hypothetical protein ATY80_12365 [Rhizobium sp. R711]
MISTRDEARASLDTLNTTIGTAVLLLRQQQDTIEQFMRESRDMDSVGHVLDPTLFNSSERRATEAILKPIYAAAVNLIETYDRQIAQAATALRKVTANG